MKPELNKQKTTSKKALCTFIAMLMIFSFFGSTNGVFAAEETMIIDSGNCGADGDNVTWILYDDGELVISGEGAMADYNDESEDYAPWVGYKNKINSVVIKKGVTAIGSWAFAHYEDIKTIDIADSVISIGECAIYYCNNLISLEIPKSVTELSRAVINCLRLEAVFLPRNIKLGYKAFSGCMSLSGVYYEGSREEWELIENSFDSLSLNGAEIYCDSVGMGEGTKITEEKFNNEALVASGFCGADNTNLSWFLYGNGTLTISGYGDMADYDWQYYVHGIGDTPWSSYHAQITDLIIENGVTSIGEKAFWCTKYLKSIEIPDSVTDIGEAAFGNCPYLISVKIGNGVSAISADTFSQCVRLNNVKLGYKIKTIGDYAFGWCSELETVTVWNSVTDIEWGAFYDCYSLTDVYYIGTEEEWKNITFYEGNEYLTNATIHYIPHTHSYTSAVTVPTCTTEGYTVYTCSCGDSYVADKLDALGHNTDIFTRQPSCTQSGIREEKCSRCDYCETVELPATGHNYEDGLCTECGDSISEDCSCMCHKTGFFGIIGKIIIFFYKLFNVNPVCECDAVHW